MIQLCETIKLYLTKEQIALVDESMKEYLHVVNGLVDIALNGNVCIDKYTSKHINANLPSAVKNQAIREAQSLVRRHKKQVAKIDAINADRVAKKGAKAKLLKVPKTPVLKRGVYHVNNQNFTFNGVYLDFPMMQNGKYKRHQVLTSIKEAQQCLLHGEPLGMLRLVRKKNKILAQIAYKVKPIEPKGEEVTMGVDIGIKCPAVGYTSTGKIKFFGNGGKARYIRRCFNSKRKKYQKKGQFKKVKQLGNKEQRVMMDIDHKLSRAIIQYALAHRVTTIRLELIKNIRSKTRQSRKNNKSLHDWSFYRLAKFIEYKAILAGIRIEYVNPAYTSQRCPHCGKHHKAIDRQYVCGDCGYRQHRDVVGAINICKGENYIPV